MTILVVAVILAITFPATVLAETTDVSIPGESWRISFDAPPLSQKQEARRPGGDYAFRATNSTGRGASRNPKIAKDNVVISEGAKYVRVQYDIVTEFQGQSLRQRHVHYYVAFRGRWIDMALEAGS